ncbi:hypothetical protein NKG05_30800 [Oerskovia sp. M15]
MGHGRPPRRAGPYPHRIQGVSPSRISRQVAAHALRIAAPDHPGQTKSPGPVPWSRPPQPSARGTGTPGCRAPSTCARPSRTSSPNPPGAPRAPGRRMARPRIRPWTRARHRPPVRLRPREPGRSDRARRRLVRHPRPPAAAHPHRRRPTPHRTPQHRGRQPTPAAPRRRARDPRRRHLDQKELSEAAGITRRTLDSWLGAADISGLETPSAP